MKAAKFYFNLQHNYSDIYFILKQLEYNTEDCDIWLSKLSGDTHSIRVDSVSSKLLKAMFR